MCFSLGWFEEKKRDVFSWVKRRVISTFPCEVWASEPVLNWLDVSIVQITVGDDNKLPFLALSEGNKLLLFPLLRLHREAPTPASSYPWTDTTNLSAVKECPLEKWIHIGCEVCCRHEWYNMHFSLAEYPCIGGVCRSMLRYFSALVFIWCTPVVSVTGVMHSMCWALCFLQDPNDSPPFCWERLIYLKLVW